MSCGPWTGLHLQIYCKAAPNLESLLLSLCSLHYLRLINMERYAHDRLSLATVANQRSLGIIAIIAHNTLVASMVLLLSTGLSMSLSSFSSSLMLIMSRPLQVSHDIDLGPVMVVSLSFI